MADKQTKTISLLGAGWLGMSLLQSLQSKDYLCKASTTTIEKMNQIKALGAMPYLLELNPEAVGKGWQDFLATEVLLINIPPQTRKATLPSDFHLQQIQHLIEQTGPSKEKIQKIIFVSATSVYPDVEREVTEVEEITLANTGNAVLWQAERLMEGAFGDKLVILRLGGLLGYERIPGRYFAGKKGLTTGEIPVNFIHRDDAVAILEILIEMNFNGLEIFNGVSPQHPVRRLVYQKNAEDFGFEMPEFEATNPKTYKIVNGQKLTEKLGYVYKYPNPLDYRYVN